MGFVLKRKETFLWPVKLQLPGDGEYQKETIELEFKSIKADEFQKMLEKKEDDEAFARQLVVGWKGVTDEDGNEVVFNEENFAALLQNMGVASQISLQYMGIFSEAIRGN